MNILHMKYAVEVAKLGSLNKAAENLMIATPNISRSIKELEADLGITIFQRSAKGVVLTPDGEEFLDNASYFDRIFARSGGLSNAVAQGLKEQNIDFDLKAVPCDGIEACRTALLKLNKGILGGNFIEGMACIGGCIGGAGCLTHGEKNKAEVDKYGREAFEKTIGDAVSQLK